MATLALLTAAGAGLASVGLSVASGEIAARNAKADARTRRRLGVSEKADARRSTRRLLAAQTAAFAGAGVATDTGTPLDVLGDTVLETELASLRGNLGRQTESSSLIQAGRQARVAGFANAAGTILGGASALALRK